MKQLKIAAIVLFGFSLLAADEKPKHIEINFTQPLVQINGKPLHISDEKSEVMTLGDATVMALEGTMEEDRGLDGKTKFERDQLARRIYKQKDVVLSVEEIALIKERIGKAFAPAVVGAAWPLLDPSLKAEKK